MATFPALFDTNVLFGFHLNDVILGLAERGLFRPLWSERILKELSKNLAEHDEFRSLSHQLQALDLISRTRSVWSAGPSARSLLPGANLLADPL